MRTHPRKSSESKNTIVLASQSYSRQRLISLAGIDAEITPSEFDEYAVKLEDFSNKATYVSTIATGKLLEVADRIGADEHTYICGGDLVVFLNESPLHKPTSYSQAREYMQLLSGKTHLELCATGFWSTQNGIEVLTDSVLVSVPELTPTEIEDYLEIAHPLEKAGGFSIIALQKILRQRTEPTSAKIEGSMSALLGISLPKLESFFQQVGVEFPVSAEFVERQLSEEVLTGEFIK